MDGSYPLSVRWSQHGVRRDILRDTFCDWFGITDAIADVLVALYDNGGSPVTWQTLAMQTDSHRPPAQASLWERISQLRKAMECEAVDHIEGKGYALTEIGLTECNQALTLMGARLQSIAANTIESVSFTMPSGAKMSRPK